MNAVNVVRFLNKSFSKRVKPAISSLKYVQRNYLKPKQPSSFDVKPQCGLCTYMGVFLYRNFDGSTFDFQKYSDWGVILKKEVEYSKVLGAACIFFGWAFFLTTTGYTMRSIRKIILHKDARQVTLVTFNLPGFNKHVLPLNNVSSVLHRTKAKKYIPLKLKNTYFHYLIDIRGEFSDPVLFDFTVGLRRSL